MGAVRFDTFAFGGFEGDEVLERGGIGGEIRNEFAEPGVGEFDSYVS